MNRDGNMPDPRRSVEIELQWLVSVYSPKVLSEIKSMLMTSLEACGMELTFITKSSIDGLNHSNESSSSLFPSSTLTLRGSDKDVFCYLTTAGDKISKINLHVTFPDWNRGTEIVIESDPSATIIMEQIFNAGSILSLALEQLNNSHIPESGTDDCFARSTFISKLNDIKRFLARSIQQLIDYDQQSVFPYKIFDPSVYKNSPEDLVVEYLIQSGKICANVYVIAHANHQSPSHIRQKSTVSQPSATGSFNQMASSYYFYDGSPVEVVYHSRLEAILPSAVTALTSIENALGLLDDLCQKIDYIQKLLDSY